MTSIPIHISLYLLRYFSLGKFFPTLIVLAAWWQIMKWCETIMLEYCLFLCILHNCNIISINMNILKTIIYISTYNSIQATVFEIKHLALNDPSKISKIFAAKWYNTDSLCLKFKCNKLPLWGSVIVLSENLGSYLMAVTEFCVWDSWW